MSDGFKRMLAFNGGMLAGVWLTWLMVSAVIRINDAAAQRVFQRNRDLEAAVATLGKQIREGR